MALAKRFCEAIKGLSPQLTESELASLNVLGFQLSQQKPMSPPPSRNGPIVNGQYQRHPNSPPFVLNPLLSQARMPPHEASLTPPSSDSGSESDVWSPRSTVSSASSNESSNLSPRANLGRCYLKTLGCAISAKAQALAPSCLSKRCASPLSIIAACNDRKRVSSLSSFSGSPMSMDEVRPSIPATPRLRIDATPASAIDEEQDWSSAAGTIDPKLLQLNSSALTAVKGLCSLSQRATVFQPPNAVHGSKRTFGKSYSMGTVQSDYESAKRRRSAISDQTLARML
jgi:hypothetical protein